MIRKHVYISTNVKREDKEEKAKAVNTLLSLLDMGAEIISAEPLAYGVDYVLVGYFNPQPAPAPEQEQEEVEEEVEEEPTNGDA